MNQETLNALEGSVAHWERLKSGLQRKYEDIGPKDCALCQMFYMNGCGGCPVAERVGDVLCEKTPYIAAQEAKAKYGIGSKEFKEAAQKEYDFLVSLRPKQTNQ